MAIVNVSADMTQLLSAKVLEPAAGGAIQLDPSVVATLQTYFGAGSAQVQSVKYAELETLVLANGTPVFVSDYGNSGQGSFWVFQNAVWLPLNGHLDVYQIGAPITSTTNPTAQLLTTLTLPSQITSEMTIPQVVITLDYLTHGDATGTLALKLYCWTGAAYVETTLKTITLTSTPIGGRERIKIVGSSAYCIDGFDETNSLIVACDSVAHTVEFRFYATSTAGTVILTDLTQSLDCF